VKSSARAKWKASVKLPAPIALAILQRVDRLIPMHQDHARALLAGYASAALGKGARHEDVIAEIAAYHPAGGACRTPPASAS
jgi:hypothetical protein